MPARDRLAKWEGPSQGTSRNRIVGVLYQECPASSWQVLGSALGRAIRAPLTFLLRIARLNPCIESSARYIGASDDDGMAAAPVGVPPGPRPGLSERGPRQRGPRAMAEAAARPEGGEYAL